jgi:serine/threonine protein phosphatase PrpC
MKNKIEFSGNSDSGKIRTNNEDAFVAQKIWDDNHILAVAIDGVGGYDGGEVAAGIAQKTIVKYLQAYPNGERLELLKQAVIEANNKIFEERTIQTQFANMSCVLTACLIEVERKQINMVHVGDTRLYQYWHNELKKLSHDHSLVGYREEMGDLTEDEAMNHPQRNIIDRDTGSNYHEVNDNDFLEASVFPLQPNSTLLLCSDGLCDMLKSSEMVSVLEKKIPLGEKVQQLIDFANRKGGKDNVTVVLLEYLSDEPESVSPNVGNKQLNIRIEPVTAEKKHKSKKGKKKNIIIALVMLAALALGGSGGWFGRAYYEAKIESLQFQKDSCSKAVQDSILNVIRQDTTLNNINNIDTLKIIIKEKEDTISIQKETIEALKNAILNL